MSRSQPGAAEPGSLSQQALRQVCDTLYRRTGMAYGETKRYYIERRVSEGIERTGASSFAAYMQALERGGAEVEQFINSFTVNETYFYREEHQLRCLSLSLLPDLVRSRPPGDLIRLWSVPCSTGEEPYSLALWLLENWAMVDAYNVEIVGSDIDTTALAAAASGHYGRRAVSRLPPDILARYFEAQEDRGWRIIADLRESVKLTQVNLIDRAMMAAQGAFDIIFCRNVLIYFDAASRLIAAANLFAALRPGGYICLGHTESMSRISDQFEVRRFEQAVVHQRPVA